MFITTFLEFTYFKKHVQGSGFKVESEVQVETKVKDQDLILVEKLLKIKLRARILEKNTEFIKHDLFLL